MHWRNLSVGLVWALAVVAAVLSVGLGGELRLGALAGSLAALILVTFLVQFTVHSPGAVRRIVASAGGSVLILVIAMLVAEAAAMISG